MTNYNERLDKILDSVWNEACDMMEDGGTADVSRTEAKQAITSLIKELVAEAKPKQQKTENMGDTFKVNWARGHNVAIEQFEQNLLKALEEV